MAYTNTASITSLKDYPATPQGKAAYWSDEIAASQTMLRRWHKQADRIHKRYIDEREATSSDVGTPETAGFRLNIFYSNVQTLYSLLYGRVPKVDVKRRYDDSKDDVARVAAVIMERLLNNDMAENPVQYESVLTTALLDRLVPGLGCARVRYEVETGERTPPPQPVEIGMPPPAPPEPEKYVVSEAAPVAYVHWRDVLWSWTRTAADLRWLAYRHWYTKDEATERYGEKRAGDLTYKQQKMNVDAKSEASDIPEDNNYWLKAEVWQIWCKETRTVYEWSDGVDAILKTTPDPLELGAFFPSPTFFMANPTSSIYRPTPDYHLTEDLYNEIDQLQTRIAVITDAVKAVGAYDDSTPELQRIFNEGVDNVLIPVKNWALFGEKGGLKGAIEWVPIADLVATLLNLRQLRDETIELLYNVSGMADVMRGSLANQYEGVGQTDEKVKFGSARIQQLQEQYARFATQLMALKAEVIARHFEPQSIALYANVEALMEDPQLIEAAIARIKEPVRARLQVEVKAESLALADYAQLQAQRAQVLKGVSEFMTAAGPIIQFDPQTMPFMLQMLQWTLAGFRGSDEIEGVIDKAIEAIMAQQKAQQGQEKPDPEAQKEKAKSEGDVARIQAKLQADLQLREADKVADIETQMAAHEAKMRETEADYMREAGLIQLKAQAEMQVEQVTSAINAEQQRAGVEAEVMKGSIGHRQDLEKMMVQTANKIRETRVQTASKIMTTPEPKENDDDT